MDKDLARVKSDGFHVKAICAGVIECEYTDENFVGHGLSATGASAPNRGLVTAHKQPVNHLPPGVLGICPTKAELDALFEALPATYLRS
jgi:hypothetical protein